MSLGSEGCMTMDCCAYRGRRWNKLVHSGLCGQLKEQDSRNLGTFCQALHFVVVHKYQVQIQPHFNFAGLIFCYLIAPAALLPTWYSRQHASALTHPAVLDGEIHAERGQFRRS